MARPSSAVDFDPDRDIPSLSGKVIFITGGTTGLGAASIRSLVKHEPEHIYFSGRNAAGASRLMDELKQSTPTASLTFVEMDLASLRSVRDAVAKTFTHDRLDVLMCNAGIMAAPPGLSADGYEVQFATNHLGHAMVVRQLLPVLLRTARQPGSDVRLLSLTSEGWASHPRPQGVVFDKLRTTQEGFLGSWVRYGQSKLANIVYAAELARRHPDLLSVSVHPGVVETGLVTELTGWKKAAVYIPNWLMRNDIVPPEKGCHNQLWCAVGAGRDEIVNGGLYYPVGVLKNDKLDKTARSPELAGELWDWTEEVLAKC